MKFWWFSLEKLYTIIIESFADTGKNNSAGSASDVELESIQVLENCV